MYVLHILLVSYYTNKGLVLLKLASIVLSFINTRPCLFVCNRGYTIQCSITAVSDQDSQAKPLCSQHSPMLCYVCISLYHCLHLFLYSYDKPTTVQTETDFTWKPYRSLKGGVCY